MLCCGMAINDVNAGVAIPSTFVENIHVRKSRATIRGVRPAAPTQKTFISMPAIRRCCCNIVTLTAFLVTGLIRLTTDGK